MAACAAVFLSPLRFLRLLIEMLEDDWPGLLVLVPRLRVVETRMRETQMCSRAPGRQFDGDHRFRALGAFLSGHPRQFDQPVALQSQESAIVGMALRSTLFLELVHGFEEEDAIHLRIHKHRPRRGKPTVEMPRPCRKQHVRWSAHDAFDGQMKRSGGKIRRQEQTEASLHGDGLGRDLLKAEMRMDYLKSIR